MQISQDVEILIQQRNKVYSSSHIVTCKLHPFTLAESNDVAEQVWESTGIQAFFYGTMKTQITATEAVKGTMESPPPLVGVGEIKCPFKSKKYDNMQILAKLK